MVTALGLPPDCFAVGDVGLPTITYFIHRHRCIDLRISMPAMPISMRDHYSLFFSESGILDLRELLLFQDEKTRNGSVDDAVKTLWKILLREEESCDRI